MKQTITTLVDDIDGNDADETITFALDGTTYEIDLSHQNAAALREAIRPYTRVARKAGDGRQASRSRITLPSTGQSRNAEIRAWAHSNGHDVPARGRIPQRVVAAYQAAKN
ncbi:Lsr2 family protein [Terrabacter ginsenosidimutans]|uniref:Lsr2 family protein n=1 Tax=Terrabacter ginsenosidimutans TaxID=490575 RepID=A0ABP7EEB1_9MICO